MRELKEDIKESLETEGLKEQFQLLQNHKQESQDARELEKLLSLLTEPKKES